MVKLKYIFLVLHSCKHLSKQLYYLFYAFFFSNIFYLLFIISCVCIVLPYIKSARIRVHFVHTAQRSHFWALSMKLWCCSKMAVPTLYF